MSFTNDELETLRTDSALAAIHPDTPLGEIEAALRSLAQSVALSDPLRRAVVREATIERLRQAGVGSPAAAAFGPEPKRDPAIERAPLYTVEYGEPWPEPVKGADLLDPMAATFNRFLVLSPFVADAEALWCLKTYAYDAGVSPNLCISSQEKPMRQDAESGDSGLYGSAALAHGQHHAGRVIPDDQCTDAFNR